MKEENTITPNGGSKDLYTLNKDKKNIKTVFTDVLAVNPILEEILEDKPGSYTKTGNGLEIDFDSVEKGYVTIKAVPVDERMVYSSDAINKIKASIKSVKDELIAKGAMTTEMYIELKQKMAEKTKKNISKEEKSMENDDIEVK